MNSKLTSVISLAIVTESTVTYLKDFLISENFSFGMILSLLIGILIALAYKIDFLECLELKSCVPYFGVVLTGILISRGSNYIYDLLNLLSKVN